MKKGDIIAFIHYGEVTEVVDSKTILFKDLDRDGQDGKPLVIKAEGIADTAYKADSYDSTESVTRTSLIEIFMKVGDKPFTVNFESTKGNRTLRGRFISVDVGRGRSNVIDLDVPKSEHQMRQVDHRTLNWLVFDNKKYIVK